MTKQLNASDARKVQRLKKTRAKIPATRTGTFGIVVSVVAAIELVEPIKKLNIFTVDGVEFKVGRFICSVTLLDREVGPLCRSVALQKMVSEDETLCSGGAAMIIGQGSKIVSAPLGAECRLNARPLCSAGARSQDTTRDINMSLFRSGFQQSPGPQFLLCNAPYCGTFPFSFAHLQTLEN